MEDVIRLAVDIHHDLSHHGTTDDFLDLPLELILALSSII